MMKLRRLLCLSVLVWSCLLSQSSSLSATVMLPQTLENLVQQADYIVRVKVTKTIVRREQGRHISAHSLKLIRLYDKAAQAPAPTSLTLETLGGVYQGLQQKVSGSPMLKVGEEVIMLLTCPKQTVSNEVPNEPSTASHHHARCRLVGMGQGLWRMASVNQSSEELWSPSLEGLNFAQGGKTVTSPLKPRSLQSLLDLVGRVRQASTY